MAIRRIVLALLLCVAGAFLSGCGGGQSKADEYEGAIAGVDGVESQSVEHTQHAGKGTTTRIEITASTNEDAELKRILEDTVRAYVDRTERGEETRLNFVLYSQDQSKYLTPSDLGSIMTSLKDIREHLGM